MIALAAMTGCSDVTQTEEDCTDSQFFDLNLELCRTCPPLEAPECSPQCGIALVSDERGCLVAECDCEGCAEGEFFDADALACAACPAIAATCAEGCQPVSVNLDARGCSVVACACEEVCNPTRLAESGDCEPCPDRAAPDCGARPLLGATDAEGCPLLACDCAGGPPEGFSVDDRGLCLPCEGGDCAR